MANNQLNLRERGLMLQQLPGIDALYAMYESFNTLYFGGRLPPAARVTIEYSNRLTASAGICYPKRRTIRISTHYHLKFPEDVGSTLLHEMIHFVVPKHGADFKALAARIRHIGGQINLHAKERATAGIKRWLYICRSCGMEHPRMRRLKQGGVNHRCGRCRGELREEQLL